MGYNYTEEKEKFEKEWARNLKLYLEAGMSPAFIAAMREFDEAQFRKDLPDPEPCAYPMLGGPSAGAATGVFRPLAGGSGLPVGGHLPWPVGKGHGTGQGSPTAVQHRAYTARNRREIAHNPKHGFVPP